MGNRPRGRKPAASVSGGEKARAGEERRGAGGRGWGRGGGGGGPAGRSGQGRQGEQGSRKESRRRRRDPGGVALLLNAFQNITKVPELKKRLLVTALFLTVYRIGVYIPTPGIDTP